MKEMTRRQREVLDFVRTFSERHGVPPAVREIGERFGFTARAAFDHLRALERKGMLERRVTNKRASRTLVLPGRRGPGIARSGTRSPCSAASPPALPSWPWRTGRTASRSGPCGSGRQGEEVFALRVRGDSMIGAHIVDGDFVMVRRQDSAAAGGHRRRPDRRRSHREALRARGRRRPSSCRSIPRWRPSRSGRSGRTFAFSARSSVFCAACDGRGEDGHGRRTNEHASTALVPQPPGRARRAGASARRAQAGRGARASGSFFVAGYLNTWRGRRAADWLAGGAMLLAAASWGLLAALLP